MYDHRGVKTNNNAESYNSKLGNDPRIKKHPNPYTHNDVMKEELQIGLDIAMTVDEDNDSKEIKRKLQTLQNKKLKAMKKLKAQPSYNLFTYLKSIGRYSMSLDARILQEQEIDRPELNINNMKLTANDKILKAPNLQKEKESECTNKPVSKKKKEKTLKKASLVSNKIKPVSKRKSSLGSVPTGAALRQARQELEEVDEYEVEDSSSNISNMRKSVKKVTNKATKKKTDFHLKENARKKHKKTVNFVDSIESTEQVQ